MESLEYVFKGCYVSASLFSICCFLLLIFSYTIPESHDGNKRAYKVLRLFDACLEFCMFFLACGFCVHVILLLNRGI